MIATVCEFCGAYFLGGEVTDTVRKKIVDFNAFIDKPEIFMLGMMAALLATAFWLILATYLGMPVSTTHSIIGSILGFGLAANLEGAINWDNIKDVIISWFVSPGLSGVFALVLFLCVRTFVLRANDSTRAALIFYPILIAFCVGVNTYYFIYKGASRFKGDVPEEGLGAGISIAVGVGVGLFLKFIFVDMYLKKKLAARAEAAAAPKDIELDDVSIERKTTNEEEVSEEMPEVKRKDNYIKTMLERDTHSAIKTDEAVRKVHENAEVYDSETEFVFTYLQVFTACVDSIGHGANDVANSIGPFAAVVGVYNNNEIAKKEPVPGWILAFGAFGIVVGLLTYGYKIIESIGVKLMVVTPSRGFCIELGAAIVIVMGSGQGWPLSTTHCQVGAEIGVGLLEGKSGVNGPLLAKVAAGWVFTLVFCGLLTAAIFSMFAYSPALVGYEGTRAWAETYGLNETTGAFVNGTWVQA